MTATAYALGQPFAPHVETSPTTHYGEPVTGHVLRCVETGKLRYRCRDESWRVAFPAWQKARGDAPEPFPASHVMFVKPSVHGCVPAHLEGEERRLATRRAVRARVVSMLGAGWDRELRESRAGMRKLAAIVRVTVKHRMNGEPAGVQPFVACMLASL